MGEVRLTVFEDPGGSRVVYAVRRRAARTPVEMAQLATDLTAAVHLVSGKQPQLQT